METKEAKTNTFVSAPEGDCDPCNLIGNGNCDAWLNCFFNVMQPNLRSITDLVYDDQVD